MRRILNDNRPTIALAAALSSLALLVGCGDDSSTGSSTSAEPLSKVAFIEKATELCRANRAVFAKGIFNRLEEQEKEGKSKMEAQLETIQNYMVPHLREQNEEIRELGIPSGDEDQVNEIIASMEKVLDEAEEDPAKWLRRQAHFGHPFEHAHDLAEVYGIPACARA